MRWEVSILSANEYTLEEIISLKIPDQYFLTDNGEMLVAATFFDREETINQLTRFLFQGNEPATEIFRDHDNYVLDLSPLRQQLIDFDFLESNYQKWIEETGRENTMDEYGILIDFIGYARQTSNKKSLLMVVSKRQR
ncbi:MAG TPA: hypothetical protein VK563_17755 [Puia sp.]|nr:hypothetical protein [Puia sp.]